MFRKKYSIKGKNVVGGKELKQLREECLALYGLSSGLLSINSNGGDDAGDNSEELSTTISDAFFPKKAQCVQHLWLISNTVTQVQVYTVLDVPLFMRIDEFVELDAAAQSLIGTSWTQRGGGGGTRLVPTMFGYLRLRQLLSVNAVTLAEAAKARDLLRFAPQEAELSTSPTTTALLHHILPLTGTFTSQQTGLTVWINSATTSFLFSGAHLMCGGVHYITRQTPAATTGDAPATPAPHIPLTVGEIAVVCVLNNPVPVGIGAVTPALAKAFNGHAYTATVPSPRYPASLSITYLRSHAPSLTGPGLVMMHTMGDALWTTYVNEYLVFSTAKAKLSRDSDLVVPHTHVMGKDGTGHHVDSFVGVDLLGLKSFAVVASPDVPEDPQESESGGREEEAVEGGHVDGTGGANGATDEPDEALGQVDGAEEADIIAADVDWWSLFPTVDSMILFALHELVRHTPMATNKNGDGSGAALPVTSFISRLVSHIPCGLPLTHGSSLPPDDDPRLALLNSTQIDWKKTSYKKAMGLLTSVDKDLLELKEPQKGVYVVAKLYKSSLSLRDHKRMYRDFIQLVHGPAVEELDEHLAMERVVGSGSDASSNAEAAMKLKAYLRIVGVDYFYRPSGGLHAQLHALLVNGVLPSLSTPHEVEAQRTVPSDDDNDNDDVASATKGLVTLKQLRDNLRSYVRHASLMLTTTTAPIAAVPTEKESADGSSTPSTASRTSSGGVPSVKIDAVLQLLWPSTAKDIPDVMPLLDVDKMVEARFCVMHLIRYGSSAPAGSGAHNMVRAPRPRLRNGKPPMVHLYEEKRSGNKIVTIVRGLDAFGFSLEALELVWKQKFATSVSIVDPVRRDQLVLKSGTKVAREIHLQGPQPLEAFITSVMGLPQSCLVLRK